MAINYIAYNGRTETNKAEFIIDTPADVANLPTDLKSAIPGSTAICTEPFTVYILGNDGVWKEI